MNIPPTNPMSPGLNIDRPLFPNGNTPPGYQQIPPWPQQNADCYPYESDRRAGMGQCIGTPDEIKRRLDQDAKQYEKQHALEQAKQAAKHIDEGTREVNQQRIPAPTHTPEDMMREAAKMHEEGRKVQEAWEQRSHAQIRAKEAEEANQRAVQLAKEAGWPDESDKPTGDTNPLRAQAAAIVAMAKGLPMEGGGGPILSAHD